MTESNFIKNHALIAGKRNRSKAHLNAIESVKRVRNMVVPTIINGSIYPQKIDTLQKVYDAITISEDKYLYKDYIMTKYTLFEALAECKPAAIRLFKLIYMKLGYTTNIVSFTYQEAKNLNIGKYNIEIDGAIKDLVDKNIIFYTNIKSTYVINHTMYFKGDWNKFCRIYKEQYEDLPVDTYYVPEEKKLYIKDII